MNKLKEKLTKLNIINFLMLAPLLFTISLIYLMPKGLSFSGIIIWIAILSILCFRQNKISLSFNILKPFFLTLSLFVILQLLSYFIHGDSWRTTKSFITVSLLVLFFQYHHNHIKLLKWATITTGLCFIAFLFYQLFILKLDGDHRLAFYTNPIILALGIYVLMSVAFFYCLTTSVIIEKFILLMVVIAAMIAIILTGSRGVIIAIPVPFLLGLSYLFRNKVIPWKRIALYLIPSAMIMFLFLFLLSIQFTNRFSEIKTNIVAYEENNPNTSVGMRFTAWHTALELYKTAPIFGVGFNNKHNAVTQLIAEGKVDRNYFKYTDIQTHAHNQILTAMQYRGTLGLIALLLLYFIPLAYLVKDISKENQWTSYLGVSVIIGYIISGLTDVPLNHAYTIYCYILICTFCLTQIKSTRLDS